MFVFSILFYIWVVFRRGCPGARGPSAPRWTNPSRKFTTYEYIRLVLLALFITFFIQFKNKVVFLFLFLFFVKHSKKNWKNKYILLLLNILIKK